MNKFIVSFVIGMMQSGSFMHGSSSKMVVPAKNLSDLKQGIERRAQEREIHADWRRVSGYDGCLIYVKWDLQADGSWKRKTGIHDGDEIVPLARVEHVDEEMNERYEESKDLFEGLSNLNLGNEDDKVERAKNMSLKTSPTNKQEYLEYKAIQAQKAARERAIHDLIVESSKNRNRDSDDDSGYDSDAESKTSDIEV